MEQQIPTTPEAELSGPSVRLKRRPERGSYDRERVFSIIDEALLAHVAFAVDGCAMALPTAHARIEDQLYLHGARANRMLHSLCDAPRASVTFTLLDGLVLARTAFHHSMNYRSVVVFGPVCEVTDVDEKRLALRALIEHMAPGRMRELAEPTDVELQQTFVLRLRIEEASAKVRAGDPVDAKADLGLDVWAGTVPLALTASAPKADALLPPQRALSPAAAARSLPRAQLHETAHGAFLLSNDPGRLQHAYIYRYLRDESYWAQGLEREAFETGLRYSLCVGAYLGDKQVAFARVVSDRGRFAWLCDVFVDASQRGQGLGKAIVAFALDQVGVRDVDRCVLGTRDAHTLYERYGFAPTLPGRYMVRQRKQT